MLRWLEATEAILVAEVYHDLYLTIDSNIQFFTYKKLAESIKLNPFFLPKVRTMIPKQGSLLDRDQRHT